MSLILNIDTALDIASVCLAQDKEVIASSVNNNQQEHAAWLHTSIAELLKQTGKKIQDVEAVAVSIGPGSYTGLRVGLATAKGFCYALHIPLISVSTLELIAFAANEEADDLICPVIDARRMEVFTAVYDKNLYEINKPFASIIDENSFSSFLATHKILFCGNAVKKLQTVIHNKNAFFSKSVANITHMVQLSAAAFNDKQFANLAYSEPFYLKEFYATPKS